ncbi:hypothetical protein [Microseira wollei]|uniref:Uncharacterized protein n=1 Tax=Microseira wollei NIES-4236 TaxID=2530354 RepID=A0AAV3XFM4_9CYAN|nr:hypothetical protein [Microseira wollei]GET38247.1 hypothetical protein MiSe_30020 [Microseira wollei NIES-4236]
MGQSLIILTCENPACSQEFTKSLAEFKRSEKLGRQHFCCLKCFAQCKGIRNFKDKINTNTEHLQKGSERDEFSPFRHSLKIIKKSSKQRNKEYSVTLEDLKFLWEQQQGICPYTGWKLELLPCVTDWEKAPLTPRRASVDRKDCSKGYTIDNIQFVAAFANFTKNAFTDQDLIEFCQAVTQFRQEKKVNAGLIKSSIKANSIDEYLGFRYYFKMARKNAKAKGKECTITLEYLKYLWETQGGRCPYTGWKLDNPQTTKDWDNYRFHPQRASLDRIDPHQGYVPGNVQFVSVIANLGKRDFKEEELLEFCQAVAEYRGGNG